MQKKLIALAIAGLMSAPAFAQSSVTLYGTVDYGYTSFGSGKKDHGHRDASAKSRFALDSGVSKFNRIGFRGVEDLGNGLKAVFVLENGLTGDTTGTGIYNGTNRQSYAGLAGGFGTVAFGRQYTPQHLFSAAVDPFGKNGIAGLNNSLVQDTRLDNLGAYISPNWGGFSFVAGYTLNGFGNEALENQGDIRVWALAPSFTWNKLFVAGNYHTAKVNGAHKGDFNKSVLNVAELYGSYDFGIVKVGSLIGRRTTKKAIGELGGGSAWDKDSKLTQFMLGATFNVSPKDKIMTSWTRATENRVNDNPRRKLSQFALGYEHALSKRTAVYALAAFQSQNKAFKDAESFWSFGSNVGSVGNPALGYGGNMMYRRGVGAGMRHDF